MIVVGVINSIVGKSGNIGFRYAFVQKELDNRGVENLTLARASMFKKSGFYTLGLLSLVPRALHYLRRNYLRELNARKIDLIMFELFFFLMFPVILWNCRNHSKRVAYVVEPSPRIIRILKKYQFIVYLDIPIAPNAYVKRILKKHPECGLKYHESIDLIERTALELADQVIVPSDFVLEEISKMIPDLIKVIKIPFGSAQGKLSAHPVSKNGFKFVFAGNVTERKGIDYLLEAWIRSPFEEDELYLCGHVNRNMAKKIESMPCENIKTPGFINTGEFFPQCDVYIFPSLMEGSSKSIYEAMQAGLPCIVTHESGSIIEHGVDGLIIEPFSSDAIEKALTAIKTLPYQEMGAKGKQKVSEYTWDRYATSVADYLCAELI